MCARITAPLLSADPDAAGLEAIDVTKRYGGRAVLDSVSLTVERGEFMALVGESGAGKTTLLRIFNRMINADSGQVRVHGTEITSLNPVRLRRSMGYVQQEGGLLPHWDVLRNVSLVPWLTKSRQTAELARRSLVRVGLPAEEFGGRLPTELSGGQRQRVALARALAAEPETILLDEPFRALDAITRAELVDMVRSVLKEVGVTVLFVTHDLRSALRLADRVAVLRAGRCEQIGDPSSLRREPASPYVAELLERAGVDAP
jgi:osmoprotectant transport system ATP-binding protein